MGRCSVRPQSLRDPGGEARACAIGADYLVYRGGRATVGPVQLGSGELRALRNVADTAVYSTSRREVSRRTEDLEGALSLAAAIVEARLAARGRPAFMSKPNGIRNRSQPRRNRSPATRNGLAKPIRLLALLLAAAALGLPRHRVAEVTRPYPTGPSQPSTARTSRAPSLTSCSCA